MFPRLQGRGGGAWDFRVQRISGLFLAKKKVNLSVIDQGLICFAAEEVAKHVLLGRRERYFKRYTTVVSVSAGSGVGSPYISHECPADSLRCATIHFLIASCVSFMRLYGPR